MTDWYVIDASGSVVNCIMADRREQVERVVAGMEGGPYTVTDHPRSDQLRGYRYWDERP